MKNLPLLAACLAAVLLTACKDKSASHQGGGFPTPTVIVAAVEEKEWAEMAELTGKVDALETVEVRPRISGHLDAVLFEAGQLVKKGDVLFQIDPRWQESDVKRTKGILEEAKARAANARLEAARAVELLSSKAISREEHDTRTTGLAQAEAAVLAAEAAHETAKLDLEFTKVKAPISGRISRPILTAGNYVSGVAGFTTLLTTIVTVDPVYVYADVDEATLLKVNRLIRENKFGPDGKAEVEMGLSDDQGYPRKGKVQSLDNRIDPGIGSIYMRTIFPNPDGHLVPGLFARLRVPVADKQPVTLIPDSAIGTDQSQKFVLAISSSNTTEYRPVKIGPVVEGKRVIRSGLKTGEKVVVNGLMKVRPGMPVNVQTEESAAKSPAAKP